MAALHLRPGDNRWGVSVDLRSRPALVGLLTVRRREGRADTVRGTMQPTKTDEHALVELLDVLLDEGVVVQADVVITVADIPLVGISLRAAIAGMARMSEYGMLCEWDTATRADAME